MFTESERSDERTARLVLLSLEGRDADLRSTLLELLSRAGFFERLEEVASAAATPPAELRILILPELEAYDRGSPIATDPTLVELLIELLHDRGYERVAVGHASGPLDRWLENRDALALADLLGYGFVTPSGQSYEVLDLSEDLEPGGFPAESVLHGASLSRAWLEAQFRVVFAKSRTDEVEGYALCLHTLLSALPGKDGEGRAWRGRLDPAGLCVDLLRRTPVHFALIDAVTTNHGSFGASVPRPLSTATLIASTDAVLADWGGATKMAEDPYRSSLVAAALRALGLPEERTVDGDLAPYPGLRRVHPLVSDSFGRALRTSALGLELLPLIPRVNRERFPFRDARTGSLNSWVAPVYAVADDLALALGVVVTLQYQLSAAAEALESFWTLFDKDRLPRREVSLDLDLDLVKPEDYEAVSGYMESLERLVRDAPVDGHGLKHLRLDGSIVFEYSRLLEAPYSSFVERVPIERAVSFMNDYIGGHTVKVAFDGDGRVVHQAERTLFLPQPGFMVLYGGKPIDVAKLEVIRYAERARAIYWRTVKSSNGSADFDDGIVRFADAGSGTRVSVVARQRFALPLFFQAARLDLNPEVRNAVELWAYHQYFDATMGNFEACYEGREFRIGRPSLAGPQRETDPLSTLEAVLKKLGLSDDEKGGGVLSAALHKAIRRGPAPRETDELGFRHFRAEDVRRPGVTEQGTRAVRRASTSILAAARAFAMELADAVKKDLSPPSAGGS